MARRVITQRGAFGVRYGFDTAVWICLVDIIVSCYKRKDLDLPQYLELQLGGIESKTPIFRIERHFLGI